MGLVNCYRAATQSITVDEAFTYERFVSQPLLTSLTTFDAAHHVLHTFGCILFVRMFGEGIVPLRLTSLIFGFVYLWAVGRLSFLLFPSIWLRLLAAVLLSLNPYVFDFMSAARGYGMALALFAWAVLFLFQFADEVCATGQARAQTLRRLAILATLAVGANLTFAFPSVMLLAAVAVVVYLQTGSVRSILVNMAAPAAVTLCLFAAPLAAARRDDFYVGLASLRDSLHSFYTASFDQEWPMVGAESKIYEQIGRYLPYLLLLPGASVILATARWWNRDRQSPLRLVLGVSAITLAGSVLLVLSGHLFLNMLYPYARTGLYVIFLCSLLILVANRLLIRSGQPWRAAGYASTAGVIVIAGLYGLELRTQWYGDWRFDAGTGGLMRSLSAVPRAPSSRPVHLGVSWAMQSTVEFYRKIYHLDWLEPVTREQPSCEDDYALVQLLDQGIIDALGFEILEREPVSGAILAQRTAQSCPAK